MVAIQIYICIIIKVLFFRQTWKMKNLKSFNDWRITQGSVLSSNMSSHKLQRYQDSTAIKQHNGPKIS